MQAAYSVSAVRDAERAHANELASGALMARAAWALASVCIDVLRDRGCRLPGAPVVLLVGAGNNGGDALFAGALLARRGLRVSAVAVADTVHEAGRAALLARGGRVVSWSVDVNQARALLAAAELVVDGITGLSGRPGLTGPAAAAAAELTANAGVGAIDAAVVAVDVPSGIDPQTGAVDGPQVSADVTVTFACLKPGLLTGPGRAASGTVVVADIGIGAALVATGPPMCRVMDGTDARSMLRGARSDDHKYRRGVVGIAAGSAQFPGAAVLTACAAAHSGVGMVAFWDHAAGPADSGGLSDGGISNGGMGTGHRAPAPPMSDVARAVLSARPDAVRTVQPPMQQPKVTAWACGPGLLVTDAPVVQAVLESTVPVVLDAGALACLAAEPTLRSLVRARPAPTVITPHDAEAERLAAALGWSPRGDRRADAIHLAGDLACVVLWKGPGTVVADGRDAHELADRSVPYVDAHGGPELACAGSGDVLTGLLAGLLAAEAAGHRGSSDAARTTPGTRTAGLTASAVWLHAEAGRRALRAGAPVTAVDLVAHLRGVGEPENPADGRQ